MIKYDIPVPMLFVLYLVAVVFSLAGLPLLGLSSTLSNTAAILIILHFILRDYLVRYGPMTLRHVPMVPSVPLIGPLPFIRLKYVHLSLTRWAKKLGPVFRLRTAGDMVVLASSYQAIRDVSTTTPPPPHPRHLSHRV